MTSVRKLDPPPQQLPPSAEEVERAVLGVLLQYPAAWNTIAEILQPDMFYVTANGLIYGAMLRLFNESNPVDPVTVAIALRNMGKLEEAGGAFYLSQLATQVTGSTNAEYYARIIVEKYVNRKLIDIGYELTREGYEDPDAFDQLDKASARITDLYAATQPAVMATAADQIQPLLDKKEQEFLTFGIGELDEVAVLQAGLPAVFAGRPGIGKSIFCVEVCWHLTLAGNVLLFSPEMTEAQITARILARESEVPYSVILKGKMDEQTWDKVNTASVRIADRMTRLKIDPQSGITPDQIRMRTERAIKSHGVIAFAVDHLHKMGSGDKKVDRDDFARISQCMDGVTEAAKNTGLPALIMCQLNREVEKRGNKRPLMADLRGSGKIEENAAVVGLLYRDGYYASDPPPVDTLEINIGKNRDGAVRPVTCQILPAFSKIGGTATQFPIQAKRDENAPF